MLLYQLNLTRFPLILLITHQAIERQYQLLDVTIMYLSFNLMVNRYFRLQVRRVLHLILVIPANQFHTSELDIFRVASQMVIEINLLHEEAAQEIIAFDIAKYRIFRFLFVYIVSLFAQQRHQVSILRLL
ncbi:Hypothetical_protein [Hexamita inflata]|uniref:Hypothetical_protein n=1 Tax=Hexamita inflata TaxID=28002 RepID=A0ABP1IT40_9EUKA